MTITPSHFLYLPNAETSDDALSLWLRQWQQQSPTLTLFAMLAESSASQLPALQAICRQQNIALAGGIFPRLIWQGDFQSQGMLLYCLPCHIPMLLLEEINDDAGQPHSESLANLTQFAAAAPPGSALLTVFDGLLPNISSIMEQLYANLGDTLNYMGIAAGSESFQPLACLFTAEQHAGNSVLVLSLASGTEAFIECDYSVPPELIPASSTRGNRIQQINWRPAFDVYAELAKKHYQVDISRDNFYQHAVHFPFGIIRADGEVLVRIPVALLDDGSLLCVGEVPANALLTVVHAIEPGAMTTVEKLANILPRNGASRLLFYCAGRRMHLGDAAGQEINALQTSQAPAETGGALTLGELGSAASSHYPLFYNATIVAITGMCP